MRRCSRCGGYKLRRMRRWNPKEDIKAGKVAAKTFFKEGMSWDDMQQLKKKLSRSLKLRGAEVKDFNKGFKTYLEKRLKCCLGSKKKRFLRRYNPYLRNRHLRHYWRF